jgi:hypothetical protein
MAYNCGHPACECKVEEEGEFCSDACAAETDPSSPCRCNHIRCVGSVLTTDPLPSEA